MNNKLIQALEGVSESEKSAIFFALTLWCSASEEQKKEFTRKYHYEMSLAVAKVARLARI